MYLGTVVFFWRDCCPLFLQQSDAPQPLVHDTPFHQLVSARHDYAFLYMGRYNLNVSKNASAI